MGSLFKDPSKKMQNFDKEPGTDLKIIQKSLKLNFYTQLLFNVDSGYILFASESYTKMFKTTCQA